MNYVGTLKAGRHYVASLDKWFVAGEDVPLTEANVTAFGDKFDNVRKIEIVKPPTKKPTTRRRKATGKK